MRCPPSRVQPIRGAGSLLVPDISPNPGDSAVVGEAARAAANAMSLGEVAGRVAIEITIVLVVAKIVIGIVDRLGKRAERVSCWLSEPMSSRKILVHFLYLMLSITQRKNKTCAF